MDTVLNKINQFSKIKIILVISALYLICAILSSGFQHPDEHFQIFPPLLVKLHGLSFENLTWEYAEKMRSYLLPLFFWITSFLPLRLGFSEPFFTVILSRVFIGASALFSTYLFCKNYFKKDQAIFLPAFVFASLCWYVPFLHVRTSSENYSFILFLIGVATSLDTENGRRNFKLLVSFFFLYLSVHVRVQMSLMLLGFLLFNLKQFSVRDCLFAAFGTFMGVLFCVRVDYWGYGELTYTPWNYFYQNLVLNKADNFGRSPFLHYFSLTFLKSYIVFWPLFFSLSLFYFYKFKRSLIRFLVIPFVIVHFFVAHKELRFLNAFYFFIPIMIFELWTNEKIKVPKLLRPLKIYFILNFIFLFALIVVPASKDERFYKALEKIPSNEQIHVADDRFRLEMDFLNPKKFTLIANDVDKPKNYYEITTNYFHFQKFLNRPGCILYFSTYSMTILSILPEKIRERSTVLALFKCLRMTH